LRAIKPDSRLFLGSKNLPWTICQPAKSRQLLPGVKTQGIMELLAERKKGIL
jgi:hypothetical protein